VSIVRGYNDPAVRRECLDRSVHQADGQEFDRRWLGPQCWRWPSNRPAGYAALYARTRILHEQRKANAYADNRTKELGA